MLGERPNENAQHDFNESKIKQYKAAILPYLTYCSLWHFCSDGSGESLRGSINGVCELYFATGDHHMMSYLRVHGCLVFTIGACRISQSSCTK